MYYFGEVKSNQDPDKLSRVKVSVYGIHDNIKTYDLSWSQVIMPTNSPSTNGKGHSVNLKEEVLWKEGDAHPEPYLSKEDGMITEVSYKTIPAIGDIKTQGTLVCGIFLDNTMQEFLVTGTLPTKTAGIKDNNVRLTGTNPHVDDPKGTYEPDSAFAPVYPNNNVYETESGHVKEYDDTPTAERIMERHKSGTQYEIQPDGTKIERIVRDNYQLVVGHDTLEVYGNVQIIVSGHADIAVGGNLTTKVVGNMTAGVTGNMNASVTGDMVAVVGGDSINTITGTAGITSTGDMTLKSDNIKLDGNVVVTGTTTTSETLVLDTHKHGENNTPTNLTNGPQNG
jgi:hypothetical protein